MELCEAHGVVRGRGLGKSAFAARAGAARVRVIACPPAADEGSYLVALHEVAHHVARGRSAAILEREANCWTWALEQARCPVSDAGRQLVAESLLSYAMRFLPSPRRPRARGRVPARGHAFWALTGLRDPHVNG